MLRMKITVAIFYYISQLYYIHAVVKVQQRQFNFTGEELMFGHESFKDGKLTYAVCTNNVTSNEKVCKVIREKNPFSNEILSCNVTIKMLSKKTCTTELEEPIGVVPFARDKAVLYMIQKNKRTKIRFNTIQFDGCYVVQTNITVSNFVFSKYNVMVIPYNNSYDVVYPGVTDGFKKITINLNGEQINGPVGLGHFLWLAHFPYILPVSQKSRKKGFVYLSFHLDPDCPDVYNFNVWKPGSKLPKILGRHIIGVRSLKSTDNDLISICHDDEDYSFNFVSCTQYDVDGYVRFQTEAIGHEDHLIAFIHNVPGGGLFLFSAKAKNESADLELFVSKLDSAGKMNGSLSLGEVKLKAENLATTFYKNGDSEHCVSLVDYNAYDNDSDLYYIDQTIGCFNGSDFSTI